MQGAAVNGTPGKFGFPLWVAAGNGNLAVVKFLVAHGAIINEETLNLFNDETPLMVAAQMGRLKVVRFLVAHGAKRLEDAKELTCVDPYSNRTKILGQAPRSVTVFKAVIKRPSPDPCPREEILAALSPENSPVLSVASEKGNTGLSKTQLNQIVQALRPERGSTGAKKVSAYHSLVDAPDYHMPPDSRKYAVVIGIESYQSLPKADFARRDARDVYRHLLALGYEKRHIQYLQNGRATKGLLKGIFEQWLPANVNAHPGAEVFVYFSGHGAPNEGTHQAYLVPWDGDPEFLKDTGFSLTRLYSDLGKLHGKYMVRVRSQAPLGRVPFL
ncbi:MAG: ankyrin repeat domain-containing protein [Leptospirales bacterium]